MADMRVLTAKTVIPAIFTLAKTVTPAIFTLANSHTSQNGRLVREMYYLCLTLTIFITRYTLPWIDFNSMMSVWKQTFNQKTRSDLRFIQSNKYVLFEFTTTSYYLGCSYSIIHLTTYSRQLAVKNSNCTLSLVRAYFVTGFKNGYATDDTFYGDASLQHFHQLTVFPHIYIYRDNGH